MSKKFNLIPVDAFKTFQIDSGVLMHDFDPTLFTEYIDHLQEKVICATTGGVSVSCKPVYIDQGEDVDFCPPLKEFQKLKGWECRLSTTCLTASIDMLKDIFGVADTSGESYFRTSDRAVDPNKTYYNYTQDEQGNWYYAVVTNPSDDYMWLYYERLPDWILAPRSNLADADFQDLWWVGDRSDGFGDRLKGGMVAVQLKNALSMSGFSLQTSKRGKGQMAVEFKGFASIADYATPPLMCYTENMDRYY